MQSLLKTYKINKINLSSKFLNFDNEVGRPVPSFSKKGPANHKKLKFSFKKSINLSTLNDSQKNVSCDFEQSNTNNYRGQRSQIHQNRKLCTQNRRNTVSTYSHTDQPTLIHNDWIQKIYINRSKSKNYKAIHEKNKTERVEGTQLNYRQKCKQSKERKVILEAPEENSKLKDKRKFPMGIIKQKYLQARNSLIDEPTESRMKCKLTNSIIKSYRVKAIELANPIENNSKQFLMSKGNITVPYHIDFDNQDNLKEIYEQDIQKIIEIQKVKLEHRRVFSHQANDYQMRPSTYKKYSKMQEFWPNPWESDEKHEQIFQKDNILSI